MERVPNDLNDPKIREEYIRNHVEWFLKNHQSSVPSFIKEVRKKYSDKMANDGQLDILDEIESGCKKL